MALSVFNRGPIIDPCGIPRDTCMVSRSDKPFSTLKFYRTF